MNVLVQTPHRLPCIVAFEIRKLAMHNVRTQFSYMKVSKTSLHTSAIQQLRAPDRAYLKSFALHTYFVWKTYCDGRSCNAYIFYTHVYITTYVCKYFLAHPLCVKRFYIFKIQYYK